MRYSIPFALLLLMITSAASAEQLKCWRGDFSGRYPEATPVLEWGSEKNILWKSKMPGRSNATPLLVGDRLYLCAEPGTLLCVSAKDGGIIWQQTSSYFDLMTPDEVKQVKADLAAAGQIDKQIKPLNKELQQARNKLKKDKENAELKAKAGALTKQINALRAEQRPLIKWRNPPTHGLTGYTSSTPVTDGKHIWVCFGTGIVACYDMQGNLVWRINIERPPQHYGHSASPILVDGKLLITLRNLTAIDPSSGETLWTAPIRARWGTPQPATVGSENWVIMPGGEIIRVADGIVLAKNLGDLQFDSPVLAGNRFYFLNTASYAYELPAQPPKEKEKLQLKPVWKATLKNDRYYASPLIHKNLIYAITQNCHLTVLDEPTGEIVYEQTVKELAGRTAYPSITLGGEHVFLFSDNGTTVVIKPGKAFEVIQTNKLEPFRACPVFAGNRLYLRGLNHLYCIGE